MPIMIQKQFYYYRTCHYTLIRAITYRLLLNSFNSTLHEGRDAFRLLIAFEDNKWRNMQVIVFQTQVVDEDQIQG